MTSPNSGRGEESDDPAPGLLRADGGSTNVVFEFSVPADAVVLGETLPKFPGLTVELEQLVPTRHSPMPFLWTSSAEGLSAFGEAAAEDPSVEEITRLSTLEEGVLYQVRWAAADEGLLGRLSSGDEAILQARGRGDEWTLKIRVNSREELADFRAFCGRRDIPFHVIRIYDLTKPKIGEYDVSEKQRAALLTALELGYFNIPRDASLREVADSLGISPRAASERLRRGHTNLVSNTLTVGQPTGVGIDDD